MPEIIITLPTKAFYHADFHCPTCGSHWARLPSLQPRAEFYPMRRHCRACPARAWHSDRPVGSLWFTVSNLGRESGYEHLGRSLLLRELDLDVAEAGEKCLPVGASPGIIHPSTQQEAVTMDPNVMLKIMSLRTKADNNEITDDELRDAVRILREGRTQAAKAAAAPKKAAIAAIDGAGVLALFAPKAAA